MLLLVAIGSAVGGVCRYLIGSWAIRTLGAGFPTGTLVINVAGSLLLGLLLAHEDGPRALSPEARALLAVGFCGGFTTFSAFSYETVALVRAGAGVRALLYVLASVGLSLVAAAAGVALARGR